MEIAYTAVDIFGVFGIAGNTTTTYHIPTGTQVRSAMYHAGEGDSLDAFDAAIVALCLAGF